ncbi:MAG: hypothetical protein HDR10_02820 [Lachnospiraceae bacterium]|nr:hypothetical protein [Lachnospiraceae bacterium]
MILVDIQVPAIDRIYDFELDEEMPVGELIKEVTETIAQKEKMDYDKDDKMHLYAMWHECMLKDMYSLKSQGIRNGERLILM